MHAYVQKPYIIHIHTIHGTGSCGRSCSNVSEVNFVPLKGGNARDSMTWSLHLSDPVHMHFLESARAKPHLKPKIQQELLAAAAEATLPSNTGQSPLELCTDGLQVPPNMNVWGVPVLWVRIWLGAILCFICLGACSDVEVA